LSTAKADRKRENHNALHAGADPDRQVMARLAVLRGVMKKPIREISCASSHRRER